VNVAGGIRNEGSTAARRQLAANPYIEVHNAQQLVTLSISVPIHFPQNPKTGLSNSSQRLVTSQQTGRRVKVAAAVRGDLAIWSAKSCQSSSEKGACIYRNVFFFFFFGSEKSKAPKACSTPYYSSDYHLSALPTSPFPPCLHSNSPLSTLLSCIISTLSVRNLTASVV
jgi:hypothetical protein